MVILSVLYNDDRKAILDENFRFSLLEMSH
jgi:hypothetical protein